ncbi:MAG: glycosyltransferase, partial [bacterium]
MLKLCKELPQHGDQCLVGARPLSRWPERCARERIPFAPFTFGFDLAPWAVARLRRIGRDFKPDIVIAKGFRAARFARLTWPSAAIGVKLPSANELHDGPIERWTCNICIDRILTDNHVARAGFLRHPWVLPGKIAVAHNGVALPSSGSETSLRASLRHEFNLDADTLIIGAVGRLTPDKNYHHAIEAIARLPRDLPVRLLLVGDGPEKPALSAQAEQLGLSDRVFFAGWRDNARELLWGCDGVLHPSGV